MSLTLSQPHLAGDGVGGESVLLSAPHQRHHVELDELVSWQKSREPMLQPGDVGAERVDRLKDAHLLQSPPRTEVCLVVSPIMCGFTRQIRATW